MRGCSRCAYEDVIRVRSLGEITRVFGVVHARADPRLDVHRLLPCVIAVRSVKRRRPIARNGPPNSFFSVRCSAAPPPSPRLLTATYSKWASRRWASAHAFVPNSRTGQAFICRYMPPLHYICIYIGLANPEGSDRRRKRQEGATR